MAQSFSRLAWLAAGALALAIILLLAPSNGLPRAEAAPLFKLPWQPGLRMFVLQGPNQGTHAGYSSQYAYDFVPGPFSKERFTVRAARAGKVAKVVQQYGESPDCNPSYNGEANYVLLDHGDGLGSLYLHLTQNSVIPKAGAYVQQGDPLGQSGHTGYVCGPPHLHFAVLELKTWKSLDVTFADADTLRDGGRLRVNQWYLADAGVRTYTVDLPFVPRRIANTPRTPPPTPADPRGSARAP